MLPEGASLLTHQFQAKPFRYSRRVAAIVERIDLGCARNLIDALIVLLPNIYLRRITPECLNIFRLLVKVSISIK